jgi:hypothetical protein
VLRHSHFDVGFTHSQPILWELQREHIDLALDLLDDTADWPEHSQPRQWSLILGNSVIAAHHACSYSTMIPAILKGDEYHVYRNENGLF